MTKDFIEPVRPNAHEMTDQEWQPVFKEWLKCGHLEVKNFTTGEWNDGEALFQLHRHKAYRVTAPKPFVAGADADMILATNDLKNTRSKEESPVRPTDEYCLERVLELLSDENIQMHPKFSDDWRGTSSIIKGAEYRLRPVVYPSIDWNEFKGNYVAVNADGAGMGFTHSPNEYPSTWGGGVDQVRVDLFFKSFDAGNCHWLDSLQKRPGL